MTWVAWAVAAVSLIGGYWIAVGAERKRSRDMRDELGRLRAENALLMHQAASLAADLRDARRAPISHDAAVNRLLHVAEADAAGRA